jgi:hypothetical protein
VFSFVIPLRLCTKTPKPAQKVGQNGGFCAKSGDPSKFLRIDAAQSHGPSVGTILATGFEPHRFTEQRAANDLPLYDRLGDLFVELLDSDMIAYPHLGAADLRV